LGQFPNDPTGGARDHPIPEAVDSFEKWDAGPEATESIGGHFDRHDAGTGRTHPVDVLLPSGLGAERGRRARSGYADDVDLHVTVEKDAQARVLVRVPGNDGVRREESVDDQQAVDVHRLMLRATCCEREDLGAAGPGRAGSRRAERCAHSSMLVVPAC
jgi:hypothetical protein